LPADAAAILATPNPLTTLFALAYTNSYNGATYSSIATTGYIGNLAVTIPHILSFLSSQPWGKFAVLGYESGDGLGWQGLPAGWQALMEAFQRDARFALLYYDPDHQLSSAGEGYLPICKAAGFQSLNQFCDVGFDAANGQFGVLESIMQPVNPLSVAPAKYQGFARYTQGLQMPVAGRGRKSEKGWRSSA
jgi:hypothetical protein